MHLLHHLEQHHDLYLDLEDDFWQDQLLSMEIGLIGPLLELLVLLFVVLYDDVVSVSQNPLQVGVELPEDLDLAKEAHIQHFGANLNNLEHKLAILFPTVKGLLVADMVEHELG